MNALASLGPEPPQLQAAPPRLSRNLKIILAVLILHVGFIWGLQSGLLMRAAEIIVPAVVLTQFIDPPAPEAPPAPPAPPVPPTPVKPVTPKKAVTPARPAPQPVVDTPQPLAIADSTPSPNAPTGVTAPVASVPAPAAVAPAAPSAPAIQLPSSNADYLQNPKPAYPPLSRRLGEQGRVVVRVLIGADGNAQKAEIRQSSGFDRLDQAALNTVLKWRYVPGKRAGVAEEMWFNVPLTFVLE